MRPFKLVLPSFDRALLTGKFFVGDGCWEWDAGRKAAGYGVIGRKYAHRVVYEHFKGVIPDGLEIDHLCRNQSCVKPSHLEAVTSQVNNQRAEGVSGKNYRKVACPQGHPYDAANTYFPPGGGRHCRICDSTRTRNRWLATLAKRATPAPTAAGHCSSGTWMSTDGG